MQIVISQSIINRLRVVCRCSVAKNSFPLGGFQIVVVRPTPHEMRPKPVLFRLTVAFRSMVDIVLHFCVARDANPKRELHFQTPFSERNQKYIASMLFFRVWQCANFRACFVLVTLFVEERIRDAIPDRFEGCGPCRVALLDLHLTRQVRRVAPRIFHVLAGRFINW